MRSSVVKSWIAHEPDAVVDVAQHARRRSRCRARLGDAAVEAPRRRGRSPGPRGGAAAPSVAQREPVAADRLEQRAVARASPRAARTAPRSRAAPRRPASSSARSAGSGRSPPPRSRTRCPSPSSRRSASRTGVRLVANSAASCSSTSRWPSGTSPRSSRSRSPRVDPVGVRRARAAVGRPRSRDASASASPRSRRRRRRPARRRAAVERLQRRQRDAAADLADARLAVRDAGVDRRHDALARRRRARRRRGSPARARRPADSAGCSAAAIRRSRAMIAGASRRVQPDRRRRQRRRRRRQRAEPVDLHDRRVAEVALHVVRRVARARAAPGRAARPGPVNHALAGARQLHADLDAVARDHGHQRRARRRRRGAPCATLAATIATLRKNWWLPSDERARRRAGSWRPSASCEQRACPACVRWWHSSPCRAARGAAARAGRAARCAPSARASAGPSTSRIQRSRATTSASSAP